MGYVVLFEDMSGVFGEWSENEKGWKFEPKYKLPLSDKDMMSALVQLEIIKEKNGYNE